MTDEITEFPTKLHALPAEQRADKRAALKARKAFAVVFSPFVRAMRECMDAYRQARAQGVEREDAAKGIEMVLRDIWPKPTTKFGPQCELCEDTGYQEAVCRPYARCERESCRRKGEEWQHTFARPCDCEKGQKRASGKQAEDVLAQVGKVSKAKRGGFSRV